jgi:excisionase family DNA binding protein
MSTRPISEAGSNRLVLTVAEAADRLGISSDLAYDLVARGELPSLRLGRRIVIPRIALLAFVESATGSGQIHRGLRGSATEASKVQVRWRAGGLLGCAHQVDGGVV